MRQATADRLEIFQPCGQGTHRVVAGGAEDERPQRILLPIHLYVEAGDRPMPSNSFTACGSHTVECGTFIAQRLSPTVICSVLLYTTRMEVNWAVVHSVPSQLVASSK